MTRAFLAAALLSSAAAPALAQEAAIDRRVERLERELRAVQRQVFPGGTGSGGRNGDAPVLQPEITAPATPAGAPGSPAATAITNLTARVVALEAQLAQLTGAQEQAQYQLGQLEQRIQQLSEELARRPAPQPVAPPVLAPQGEGAAPVEDGEPAAPATPDPARAEQVAAVARPSTGDAAEDGYLYGYRLWQARLYPEAQAALKAVADANPDHRRYSWAQNLLGRAYLDDGKPALAAIAFYDNYQKDRDGERAADSLYYLGVSLIEQNKRADACRVFTEFGEVYGATARPELQAQVTAGRTRARCRS